MRAKPSISIKPFSLAWTALTDWQAITATGEESKSYLQGQVTCDVVQLNPFHSTLGAHCDAKGRMWSLFRLFHHHEGYALWQHKSAIDTALQEIKKYSVFSKVDLAISTQVSIGIFGEDAQDFIDSITDGGGDVRCCYAHGSAIKIDAQRWLLLIDATEQKELEKELQNAQQIEPELWDYFDLIQGIPRVTAPHQNSHIPQTLNLQALSGISFEKGCYTGQETVARAKYRGTNKKVMRLLQGQAMNNNTYTFEREVGENWRSAGEAIAQYQAPNGDALALIVLNKDIEFETRFKLSGDSDNYWTLVDLPYNLEE
ncbi:tRNA-modifying protein YgfZ [Vibrio rarus]|uniref:tRNA-modifying protein YgfZ n=1 Tax=Vibrio rarus TaxID=413403 RepID=UPI0021C35379|nr:tRNA-modifying protein YgfZ [Vibrio rarus]